MTMSLKAFSTLKRVMQLATSDNDAEALAALRKANSLLQAAGVDWQRVFERCVTVGIEVEEAPEEVDRRAHRARERTEILEAFETVEESDPTGSFADFIASLKEQFDKRGTLTENQKAALLKSADRARDRR